RAVGRFAAALRDERLGDAEVEELDVSRVRHEDVRGLQVAVHDETAVRGRHGVAAVAQQVDARVYGERVRAAIRGDRLALDELHDEVRTPVVRGAAVEEPRDVRVFEPGEDPALALEAREHVLGVEAAAQELDGDALLEETVGALAGEDVPHSAASETAGDAI